MRIDKITPNAVGAGGAIEKPKSKDEGIGQLSDKALLKLANAVVQGKVPKESLEKLKRALDTLK